MGGSNSSGAGASAAQAASAGSATADQNYTTGVGQEADTASTQADLAISAELGATAASELAADASELRGDDFAMVTPTFDNTIIFIDFDDTIFPTTWVLAENFLMGDASKMQLLERKVVAFLNLCRRLGAVRIVTRAQKSWIMESTHVFMPALYALLQDIHIYSCPDMLGAAMIKSDLSKTMAFHLITSPIRIQVGSLNVISIGDDKYEMQAAIYLKDTFGDLVKTVKFKTRPTVQDLIAQITRATEHIGRITSDRRNLKTTLRQI
jgi:hypothetical protein